MNEQIASTQLQSTNDATIGEVCVQMIVSQRRFSCWKKQCVGMGVREICRLETLGRENSKRKQFVAYLTLAQTMLQDVPKPKWRGLPFVPEA